MSNLTPVEALQREADHVRSFVEVDRDVFVNPKMMRVFLAAIELAKADAEWHSYFDNHEWHGRDCVCIRCGGLRDARLKLCEALQL